MRKSTAKALKNLASNKAAYRRLKAAFNTLPRHERAAVKKEIEHDSNFSGRGRSGRD
jgi:hypothetical protein